MREEKQYLRKKYWLSDGRQDSPKTFARPSFDARNMNSGDVYYEKIESVQPLTIASKYFWNCMGSVVI